MPFRTSLRRRCLVLAVALLVAPSCVGEGGGDPSPTSASAPADLFATCAPTDQDCLERAVDDVLDATGPDGVKTALEAAEARLDFETCWQLASHAGRLVASRHANEALLATPEVCGWAYLDAALFALSDEAISTGATPGSYLASAADSCPRLPAPASSACLHSLGHLAWQQHGPSEDAALAACALLQGPAAEGCFSGVSHLYTRTLNDPDVSQYLDARRTHGAELCTEVPEGFAGSCLRAAADYQPIAGWPGGVDAFVNWCDARLPTEALLCRQLR